MSIALDVALFLREQKVDKENQLTVTERGALFTLLFRQGSNPYAWISQETLAIELDIDVRNARRLLSSIAKKGWIEIQKGQKDKRNNEYRASDFLINYHQQQNRLSTSTKKYRIKLSSNSKNKRIKLSSNSDEYRIKLSSNKKTKSLESHASRELQGSSVTPKETLKANKIKSKEKGDSVFFEFTKQEMQEAIERDIDIQKCFNKFKSYKPVFKRSEWQEWFKREKNGKKAVNKTLEKNMKEHERRKKEEMGDRYVESV